VEKIDTDMGQCLIPFKQNGHGLYQYAERRGLADRNLSTEKGTVSKSK
jgi:hypothetical protein